MTMVAILLMETGNVDWVMGKKKLEGENLVREKAGEEGETWVNELRRKLREEGESEGGREKRSERARKKIESGE